MTLPRRIWADMTTAEIAAADTSDWLAVIALGAIEQHGPHLPMATDSLIGSALLALAFDKIDEGLPVIAMPMIEVGASDEHLSFAGTVSHGAADIASLVTATAEAAIRAGVRKIVLINAHGGNSPLLDIVTRDLRVRHAALAVATSWSRFGVPDGIVEDEEIAIGIHGGLIETSLMLYLRPETVKLELAEDFPSLQTTLAEQFDHLRAYGKVSFGWMAGDLNPAGVVGDAAGASAEIGQAIAHHQASGFAKLCQEVHAFRPPWFDG